MGLDLPPLLLPFVATAALAFALGLELHSYRRSQGEGIGFGTTRTLTIVGTAGFALWLLDPGPPHGLYLTGLIVLAVWLAIDLARGSAGTEGALMPGLVAVIAYALGPLILTQPQWLVAAVLVVAILMLSEKPLIRRFSDAVPVAEGVTLAKFLILAGIVLPLLPATPIPGLTDISFREVWAAVVAVSTISYVGYLAHAYFFPRAGTLLTGVLGGMYSSTAATVVLARQARPDADVAAQASAATLLATAVMYVRLWALVVALGHWPVASRLALPFGLLLAGTLIVAAVSWRPASRPPTAPAPATPRPRNPLDLPVALLFAGLFVAFAALTTYVTARFGAAGLRVLSVLVGFTDIDPFVLSLVAGKYHLADAVVAAAVLTAAGSNNLLKAGYALALSRRRAMMPAAIWLAATLPASILWPWVA